MSDFLMCLTVTGNFLRRWRGFGGGQGTEIPGQTQIRVEC